jgi:predicted nuclease of predicted toxin-antitoxin system
MKIWIDAQLPPTLANWLTDNFNLEAVALRDIQLRDAQDTEIFESAQAEKAVIMTKDSDFIDLVCRLGAPPQILWLTCGNVTNRNLRQLLIATLPDAIERFVKERRSSKSATTLEANIADNGIMIAFSDS